MKSLTRKLLGEMAIVTGRMSASIRGTGVIVAFHRVNDRSNGDALTRGTRDYVRFCRFFREYFDVVPLGELIRRLECRQSLDGLLAITHDDGYRDNFEHAAPILQQIGLPATFFVSTEFMGSDFVPLWDRDLPEQPGWMNWDQVRHLRRMGFEIGSHTSTHADMGAVSSADAYRELVDSRVKLEQELGETVDLFAYPFGADMNMSAENRALVKRAGYRCCLSCRGGLVQDGLDPYALPRVPISPWYASPSQLAFDLARGCA